MKEYPIFDPPLHLIEKGRKEWTGPEAREYRDWLFSVMEDRISYFIDYIGVDPVDDLEEFLIAIGKRMVDLLNSPAFSDDGPNITCVRAKGKVIINEEPGRSLNNFGYALAADLGLLIAKLLIENSKGKLHWKITRRPKSEMNYNFPVLRGFKEDWEYVEPVSVSIAYAHSVLRGKDGPECWLEIYQHNIESI